MSSEYHPDDSIVGRGSEGRETESKAREGHSPPGECDGQNNEGLRRELAAVN